RHAVEVRSPVRLGQGAQPLEQRVVVDDGATAEAIDEERTLRSWGTDQEVARKSDSIQGDAEAPADLDGDDGERDGDSRAAFEDVVQEAVARVVVVVPVAAEAPFPEEVAGEEARGGVGSAAGGQTRSQAVGERVERAERSGGIEVGIPDARDLQCGTREIAR